MSYILDALEKSEKARGRKKALGALEPPATSSQPPKSSSRWRYLIVLGLFLNAGFLLVWFYPWIKGGDAPRFRERASNGQHADSGKSAGQPKSAAPVAQTSGKQEIPEVQPGEKQKVEQNPENVEVKAIAAVNEKKEKVERSQTETPVPAPDAPGPSENAAAGSPVSVTGGGEAAQNQTIMAENQISAKEPETTQGLESGQVPEDPKPVQISAAENTSPPAGHTVSKPAESLHKKPETTQGLEPGQVPEDRKPVQISAAENTSPPAEHASSRPAESPAKKPEPTKAGQKPKSTDTKRVSKPANLSEIAKNVSVPLQPPGASKEVVSDLQSIVKLNAPQGRQPVQQVPGIHDLPAPIRDSLPKISVSMLIYSRNPEERWININGSKRKEGQEISPGLKLEEITPDGAIFNYQGKRFSKNVIGD